MSVPMNNSPNDRRFTNWINSINSELPYCQTLEVKDLLSTTLSSIGAVALKIDNGEYFHDTVQIILERAQILVEKIFNLLPHTRLERRGPTQTCQRTIDVISAMIAELQRIAPVGIYFHHCKRAEILQIVNKDYCKKSGPPTGLAPVRYAVCDSLADLAGYVEHYDNLEFDESTKIQLLEAKAKKMLDSHYAFKTEHINVHQERIIIHNALNLGIDLMWNIVFNMLPAESSLRLGLQRGIAIDNNPFE
ncbi:uncharacterized protein H6S33_010949 [Morchella sextelata]|uniref:uncharacterized protein n=1 Tax=Morchella sextelata TaxID=1174677 RepID=UPI001D04CD72|nr:uncharacterized protein H6S33_010949 [Morchella sextelata]KAH0611684.1 hypothetical protein H6S33_010949 [Morchella sextelata]